MSDATTNNLTPQPTGQQPGVLGQLIPGYDPNEPWYQKAADYGSLPARVGWRELGQPVVDAFAGVTGEMGKILHGQSTLAVDPYTQHELERNMTGVSLALVDPLARPAASELGIFGGSRSRLADLGERDRAVGLDAQGWHPSEIWRETGWHKGPGGDWSYEIPDQDAMFNMQNMRRNTQDPSLISVGLSKDLTLKDILSHKELFQAYPELKDMAVHRMTLGGILQGIKGAYSKGEMWLAGGTPEDTMETLLHEAQHAVQEIEGFPKGGSSKDFLPQDFDDQYKMADNAMDLHEDILKEAGVRASGLYDALQHEEAGTMGSWDKQYLEKARRVMDPEHIDEFRKDYKTLQTLKDMKDKAFKSYENLAGEVEARNVAARSRFDTISRMTPPEGTPGYTDPRDQIVTRYSSGSSSALKFKDFSLVPVDHDPFQQ